MYNADINTDRTAPAASHEERSEEQGQRGEVRVRLEGAPWLSLRDRCGAGQPCPYKRRGARRGSRGPGWRSLSRIEVAMVLVLGVLLAAVFRGAQQETLLALAPAEPPSSATVSLIE